MPSPFAPPFTSHVWAPSQITVLHRHPGVAPPSAVEQMFRVVVVVVTCISVVAVLPVVSVIPVVPFADVAVPAVAVVDVNPV